MRSKNSSRSGIQHKVCHNHSNMYDVIIPAADGDKFPNKWCQRISSTTIQRKKCIVRIHKESDVAFDVCWSITSASTLLPSSSPLPPSAFYTTPPLSSPVGMSPFRHTHSLNINQIWTEFSVSCFSSFSSCACVYLVSTKISWPVGFVLF